MTPFLIAAGVFLFLVLLVPFTRHAFWHLLGHLLEHTLGHFWEKHEEGFETFLIVAAWVVVVVAVLGAGIGSYLAFSFFLSLP